MTEIPDKKEAHEFCEKSVRNLKSVQKEKNKKDAEWLKYFKRDFEYKEEQEEVITPEKIKKIKENAKL